MPKSKRDKQVSLTKVKKKTKETKRSLAADIKKCVDDYQNLFVYTIDNMRTTKFVKIRQKYKANSRFFFGKNNVMGVALGKDSANEHAKGLSKISALLKGPCGLMFTNEDAEDVKRFFADYKESDFPRGGEEAASAVEVPAGPLPQFPFSMEPQLRKLGLPTKLDKGTVTLISDHLVCKEGEKLTAEQARILKLLGFEMSHFKVNLVGHWTKGKGFKALI